MTQAVSDAVEVLLMCLGPVGAAAASLLGRYGVRFLVGVARQCDKGCLKACRLGRLHRRALIHAKNARHILLDGFGMVD